MELIERWRSAVRDELPGAIDLRHDLHADPRVTGDEEDTAKALSAAIGLGDGERVAGTGRLIRVSEPDESRAAIALRTELDALPVVETTTVPWRSDGEAMHCCGHDVHMAALTAVVRAAHHVELPVPLVAVLQPREEGSNSGARDVVAEGALEGVDAIIAAHVQPQLGPRIIATTSGAVNAGTDEFEMVIRTP
jgi:amidohydrolase